MTGEYTDASEISGLNYPCSPSIIRRMNTLTIKIPARLEAEIREASAQEHLNKSEFVRRALEGYLQQRKPSIPFISALDLAGDLVGCFAGGPDDLASNPAHLSDFGRD